MASPFHIFRKNIKPLLAVMTALLVVGWLAGGALTGYMGRSGVSPSDARHSASAVAVSWKDGKLTNQQIQDMVVRRKVVNNFLTQVMYEGAMNAARAGVEPSPLRVQDLRRPGDAAAKRRAERRRDSFVRRRCPQGRYPCEQ